MPDLPDKNAAAQAEAAQAAAAKPAEQQQSSKDGAEAQTSATAGQQSEFNLQDVTKREDGTLEWTVTGDDGEKSTFVGKDLNELMRNVAKRVTEANVMARRQKVDEAFSKRKEIEEEGTDLLDEDPPDEREIMRETFQKRGINIAKASWTPQQWKEYAKENELEPWEVSEEREAVRNTVKEGSERSAKESNEWTNRFYLAQSTANVKGLIAEEGLNPDEYADIYEEVLKKVFADKSNFKHGILISGRIETVMAKEIMKRALPKREQELRKEIEARIAKGQERKQQVPAPANTAAPYNKGEEKKAAPTYSAAITSAAARIRAGQL